MTDNSITLKIPGTDVIIGSPADNFRVVPGGTFNNARVGKNGEIDLHQGLDQAPPTPGLAGEPVHAAVGGTRVFDGSAPGFGHAIVVETPLVTLLRDWIEIDGTRKNPRRGVGRGQDLQPAGDRVSAVARYARGEGRGEGKISMVQHSTNPVGPISQLGVREARPDQRRMNGRSRSAIWPSGELRLGLQSARQAASAVKNQMRVARAYRELLLIGAILFNFSTAACVSAKSSGASTRSESEADQLKSLASFDPDQFALSGCNDTLLKDMKSKKVVPKSIKFQGQIAAYEYRSADAVIYVPKDVNLHNDGKFILLYSIVTNLGALEFTKPFYRKRLLDVEDLFKAHFDGSKSVGYTVDQSKNSITLHTEATDIELHSSKDGINRADFQCSNHE